MSTRAHEHKKDERAKPLLRIGLPPAVHAAVQRKAADMSDASGRRVDEFEAWGRIIGNGLRGDASVLLSAPDLREGLPLLENVPPPEPPPAMKPTKAKQGTPEPEGDPWGLMSPPTKAKPVEGQKRKGKAGPKAERTPEEKQAHQAIVDHYCKSYESARKVAPVFTGKEGSAVYRLLDSAGLERALLAITNAYADDFYKNTATILTIAADPSKHLAKRNGNGSSFQAAPTSAKTWNRAREA